MIARYVASFSLSLILFVGSAVAAANQPEKFKTLDDFDQCLRQYFAKDQCIAALRTYVTAHGDQAMKAAKLVRRQFNAPVALQFFELAAKRKVEGFCQDEDLRLAIMAGLALPADFADAGRAQALFSEVCFTEYEAAVLTELTNESGNGYFKDNTCPILIKHGKIAPICAQTSPVQVVAAGEERRLPTLVKDDIRLGDAVTYSGPESERVTLAPIEGGDLYLLRFVGVSGPWNGRSILHRRVDRGNGRAEFWTEHEGRRWVSLTQEQGREAYIPGHMAGNGIRVYYSETVSQSVKSVEVLAAF